MTFHKIGNNEISEMPYVFRMTFNEMLSSQ
jgi:hypothetical protein